MSTITAAEMRIRRALLEHADTANLNVSYREVCAQAKVAARAAAQPRPGDKEPAGRKTAKTTAARPSGRRKAAPEAPATSDTATGAPEADSANRGTA